MLVQDAIDLFLKDRSTFCSPVTVQNYKNTLRYLADYLQKIGIEQIEDVQLKDLQDYVMMHRGRMKLDTHPMKPTEPCGLSARTIKTYTMDVRTFFGFLEQNEYIASNPSKRLKIIKQEIKEKLPLNSDEVNLIMEEYTKDQLEYSVRSLAIIYIMLEAGLRAGEVIRLRKQDINYQNDYIFIVKSKMNKERFVPMSQRLKKVLLDYFNQYASKKQSEVFFTAIGEETPITRNVIKMMFARLRQKTGIKRLSPHLLRHTFASSFVLGGGDLMTLKMYMGHTEIQTTQQYLHMAQVYKFTSNHKIYQLEKEYIERFYY